MAGFVEARAYIPGSNPRSKGTLFFYAVLMLETLREFNPFKLCVENTPLFIAFVLRS